MCGPRVIASPSIQPHDGWPALGLGAYLLLLDALQKFRQASRAIATSRAGDGATEEERLMARVFITGSSEGLGLLAAKLLIEQGHSVVLHGRNPSRSGDALVAASGAERAVTGDLSTIAGAKTIADEANKLGPFDAVVHNAGIGYRQTHRVETEPGVPDIFAVNVLAPYILTALIEKPRRLVYVSSGMHQGVRPAMDDLLWTKRA